jgi:hypothetical protein
VEFTHCPYDASPIEAQPYLSGTLLYCSTCGAVWGWRESWLRRMRKPDREAVRQARVGRDSVPAVHAVRTGEAEAGLLRVRASISSISHQSNTRPPSLA